MSDSEEVRVSHLINNAQLGAAETRAAQIKEDMTVEKRMEALNSPVPWRNSTASSPTSSSTWRR